MSDVAKVRIGAEDRGATRLLSKTASGYREVARAAETAGRSAKRASQDATDGQRRFAAAVEAATRRIKDQEMRARANQTALRQMGHAPAAAHPAGGAGGAVGMSQVGRMFAAGGANLGSLGGIGSLASGIGGLGAAGGAAAAALAAVTAAVGVYMARLQAAAEAIGRETEARHRATDAYRDMQARAGAAGVSAMNRLDAQQMINRGVGMGDVYGTMRRHRVTQEDAQAIAGAQVGLGPAAAARVGQIAATAPTYGIGVGALAQHAASLARLGEDQFLQMRTGDVIAGSPGGLGLTASSGRIEELAGNSQLLLRATQYRAQADQEAAALRAGMGEATGHYLEQQRRENLQMTDPRASIMEQTNEILRKQLEVLEAQRAELGTMGRAFDSVQGAMGGNSYSRQAADARRMRLPSDWRPEN